MEESESKAISSYPIYPGFGLGMGDTFVIQQVEHSHQYINSIDPYIQLMVNPKDDESIPFLDTLLHQDLTIPL